MIADAKAIEVPSTDASHIQCYVRHDAENDQGAADEQYETLHGRKPSNGAGCSPIEPSAC